MPSGSRWVLAAGLAVTLALGGCGSSSSSSGSGTGSASKPATLSSAQSTELSYVAPGAPYVVTVSTGPKSAAIQGLQSLLQQVPVASFGESALKQKLSELGINYGSDVKPLLGNPVMIGAGTPNVLGTKKSDVVIVWVTASASALKRLITKVPGVQSMGTYDGATLYGDQTGVLAVDGATAVAGVEPVVKAALDRHAHGSSFSASEYARLLSGLPPSALVSVAGDLTQILSTGKAATARRVPWVAALTGYGVTLSGGSSGVSLDYRLDTSGASLSSAEVPIETGDVVPSFAGSLPITVALSDPAHVWSFAKAAEQVTDPTEWAKFTARQAKLKAKTGSDLDSLFDLFTGSAIVASDTHSTIGRVTVSDPVQAGKILAALAGDPTDLFKAKATVRSLGGGVYAVTEPGTPDVDVGVVGDQFVAGRGTVATLRAFATAPTTPAQGAHGSVAFRIGLTQLLALTKHSSPTLSTILGTLGDITGDAQASPGTVTGSATLGLKSGG